MSTPAELNEADEILCSAAKNFVTIFYDAMDRKREKINYLYCEDSPNLVWNGNTCEGSESILKFTSTIPSTQHQTVSIDAQRIPDEISGLPGCMVILVAGSVTVGGTIHAFTQTFNLVEEDGKHKVKSNRFRYVD